MGLARKERVTPAEIHEVMMADDAREMVTEHGTATVIRTVPSGQRHPNCLVFRDDFSVTQFLANTRRVVRNVLGEIELRIGIDREV